MERRFVYIIGSFLALLAVLALLLFYIMNRAVGGLRKSAQLFPTDQPAPQSTQQTIDSTKIVDSKKTMTQSTDGTMVGMVGGVVIEQAAVASLTVAPGQKNIDMIRFFIRAPLDKDVYVTQLALGSDPGNKVMDYVENMKLLSDSGSIVSSFIYEDQFVNGYGLYQLSHPVSVAAGSIGQFEINADLKPGVSGLSIPAMAINGGGANVNVLGKAVGNQISVANL